MKKIKLLVPVTAATAVAVGATIPLAACNSSANADMDHMYEPSDSEIHVTVPAGVTEWTYTFKFREKITDKTLTPSIESQSKTNSDLIKIASYSCNDNECDVRIKWIGDTTTKSTCTFDLAFKSTKGWTNRVKGCTFTLTPSEIIHVESVTLNKTSYELPKSETVTLVPTILPSTATTQTVTWKSSNLDVATVNNGVITPVDVGTAVITCTSVDNRQAKATCNITVTEDKVLTSISLSGQYKTDYVEGQTLNLNGLIVTANYDDGSSADVTDYTTDPSKDEQLEKGMTTVTVAYRGKTAPITITVSEKTLDSIAITQEVSKKSYIQDEELNLTGMVVTAYYNNGTSETVPKGSYTTNPAEGSELKTVGTTTVTVSYTVGSVTRTTTFTVAVVAKTLTEITITGPTTTQYIEGQTLDLTGLVVTAHYDNGKTATIAKGKYTTNPAEGATLSTVGTTTVTVSYTEGTVEKTATFTVTVVAKTLTSITVTGPTKTSYTKGETLNLDGLVVTAHYDNGQTATIAKGKYTTNPAEGATLSTVGTTTVTVSYTEGTVEKTTTFTVTVQEATQVVAKVTGDHNVDIDNSGSITFEAEDESSGTSITESCTFTISALHWDTSGTPAGTFSGNTLTLSADAIAKGGEATVTATPTSGTAGTFDICIASYGKLDTSNGFLGSGRVSKKDENISGNVVMPSKYWKTDGTMVSTTSVWTGAFVNCTNITQIHIADSITDFGGQTLTNCNNFKTFTLNPTNENFKVENNCLSTKKDVSTYLLNNTVVLGWVSPDGSGGYTYPTISDGIKYIANYAFYSQDIKTLAIPTTVESIGSSAFASCVTMTQFTIPTSSQLKTIGSSAFFNCFGLTSIQLENATQLQSIGSSAFYYTKITQYTIPSSCKVIEHSAFIPYTGTTVTSITFADTSAEFIGEGTIDLLTACYWKPSDASTNASFLTNESTGASYDWGYAGYFTFTDTGSSTCSIKQKNSSSTFVTGMGGSGYEGVVYIPSKYYDGATESTITSIEAGGFANNTNITEVRLNTCNSKISFGNKMFAGCDNLEKINVRYIETVPTYGDDYWSGDANAFAGFDGLKYVAVHSKETEFTTAWTTLWNHFGFPTSGWQYTYS